MPDAPTPAEITALLRLAMRHGDNPEVRACLEAVLGWLERQAPVLVDNTPGKRARRQIVIHGDAPFLTVRQAAATLGFSTTSVYQLINKGELPSGQVPGGSAIRIKRTDLEAFIGKMFDATPRIIPPEPEPVPDPPKRTRQKTIFRPDGTPDIVAMAKEKMKQRAAEERWRSQYGNALSSSEKGKPK